VFNDRVNISNELERAWNCDLFYGTTPMFTWKKLENPQHNLTMTAGI